MAGRIKNHYHDEILENAAVERNNERCHPLSPDRMEKPLPSANWKKRNAYSILKATANERIKRYSDCETPEVREQAQRIQEAIDILDPLFEI